MGISSMKWKVQYKNERQIKKAIRSMRPSTREAFFNAIMDLQEEGPFPKGWVAEPLKRDLKGKIKLRLDRNHRVIYEVEDNVLTITIIKAGPRGSIYK